MWNIGFYNIYLNGRPYKSEWIDSSPEVRELLEHERQLTEYTVVAGTGHDSNLHDNW